MEFDINIWRGYYDRVNKLGEYIRNCTVYKIPLDKELRMQLLEEQRELLKKSDRYLAMCKMNPKPELWKYNNEDPTTWISDERFKYWDKVPTDIKIANVDFLLERKLKDEQRLDNKPANELLEKTIPESRSAHLAQ